MTARGARTDRERGFFLAAHLAILAAALLWMPFGTRDPYGVSSVLPALRPAVVEQSAAQRAEVPSGGDAHLDVATAPTAARAPAAPRTSVSVVLVTIVALAVTGCALRVRRRALGSTPVGWRLRAPSRAPPLAT